MDSIGFGDLKGVKKNLEDKKKGTMGGKKKRILKIKEKKKIDWKKRKTNKKKGQYINLLHKFFWVQFLWIWGAQIYNLSLCTPHYFWALIYFLSA